MTKDVEIVNSTTLVNEYSGQPCVKNGKGEICLSSSTPYALVPAADMAPVPQMQQPNVFKQKQEIVPAKIAPFSSGTSGSGPITSFCIQ